MTIILIVILIAASILAFKNQRFYEKCIFNPTRIGDHNEYYRLLTSGFIHANYVHLFVNVFTLFFFGRYIEHHQYLGDVHLLGIFLLGIVLSDIPTLSKHRHDEGYRSLGASGGVASVVFAYIMLSPVSTIYLFVIPVPAFIFGAFFLMYSYYQSKGMSGDNINHTAHFYGAVVGIVYTLIAFPQTVFTFFEQLLSWRFF